MPLDAYCMPLDAYCMAVQVATLPQALHVLLHEALLLLDVFLFGAPPFSFCLLQ